VAEDLIPSKRVGPVSATTSNAPEIPRQEKLETASIPNYGEEFREFAAKDNWMSRIGSNVAARASNELADQIGGEMGKNPNGPRPLPITNFDAHVAQSYETQAHATLGLEADKLITESNLELSKVGRLTPELIDKKQKQVQMGLQQIFAQAPSGIRPQLESQYGTMQIAQNQQLNNRMLRQQKEDRKSTIDLSTKNTNEQAYSLALSGADADKNGDSKAGLQSLLALNALYDNAVRNGDKTEEEAKIAEDSATISYLSGKYIRLGKIKDEEKNLPEFLKSLSEPVKDLPENYRHAVLSNVYNYFQMQQTLRAQDENLKSQQMLNRIVTKPKDITGTEWQEFKENVSPIKYQEMLFKLIQARKKQDQEGLGVDDLIQNYGSGEAQARSTDKTKNSAFYKNVATTIKNNPDISQDEAEVQVAMTSGAPVPVFIKTLNNDLTGGNPSRILSAINKISALRETESEHALIGLTKQADAIATQFEAKRGSMPDPDLAREVTHNIVNIKEDLQKTLDNSWNLKLKTKGAAGAYQYTSLSNFALKEVGLSKKDFAGSETFATIYGNDIYQVLKSNYDVAGGDYETALSMTKRYVDQNYVETRVNGPIQKTDKSIEKALGYKDYDVVPYIHQNLAEKLTESFEKNTSDQERWSVKPVDKNRITGFGAPFRHTYKPLEVVRHVRTPSGLKEFTYPVSLVGRPGNSWEIMLNTPDGPRNILLVAPHKGIISYTPDKAAIDKAYMAGQHG
jgi:hypothetical protein